MSLPLPNNTPLNNNTVFKDMFEPSIIGNIKLSEKEDRVCNVLIMMTFANNVTWIAKKAGVPRTTTAYILKKFVDHKIAHKGKLKKRAIYSFNRGMNRTHIKLKKLQDEMIWRTQKS